MYQLYHNKEEAEIEVKPIKAAFKNIEITDEITRYNQYYFFCNKRKLLKEKAEEIKAEWVKEAQETLDKLNQIMIK
ncbi:hypothetical protein BSK59_13505 [Paenibacillus odorifer]|uniref:hypothetical protein n=1 Tax=Paenibacillus TaxID=44249 RepID=UPI00096C4A7D|nr:hypothetical protein [Paenibacillus odorifer]OME55487.1 hypothetical protein BSK59_13505 [Paenibacillus odorifer]